MAKRKYQTRTHKLLRSRYRAAIRSGRGWCVEPLCLEERDGRTRAIPPDTPWWGWDVPHTPDGVGYREGPAHARCNRSEGATRGNAMRVKPRRRVL